MSDAKNAGFPEMLAAALEVAERNAREIRMMVEAGESGTDLFKLLDTLDAMFRHVWMIGHEWERTRNKP